jgi:hypothetical protein
VMQPERYFQVSGRHSGEVIHEVERDGLSSGCWV